MRRLLTVLAFTLLCSMAVSAQPTNCRKSSYQPEAISYFGDSATVIKKLEGDQMGLPDRRAYLLLVETKDSAELAFFETEDGEQVKVRQWSGASMGDLREQLTDMMLENRGTACVGMAAKSIVKARFNPAEGGAAPLPLSATAAFGDRLKKYGTQYLRVTILLLC